MTAKYRYYTKNAYPRLFWKYWDDSKVPATSTGTILRTLILDNIVQSPPRSAREGSIIENSKKPENFRTCAFVLESRPDKPLQAWFGLWGEGVVSLGILKFLQAFRDHEHDNAFLWPKLPKLGYIVLRDAQMGQIKHFGRILELVGFSIGYKMLYSRDFKFLQGCTLARYE